MLEWFVAFFFFSNATETQDSGLLRIYIRVNGDSNTTPWG